MKRGVYLWAKINLSPVFPYGTERDTGYWEKNYWGIPNEWWDDSSKHT